MTSEMASTEDGGSGTCPACGAPAEMRGGVRLAACKGDCPAICQGMAVRVRLGDRPEFLLGTVNMETAGPNPDPQAGEVAFRAELSKLFRAAAVHFAQPGTSA